MKEHLSANIFAWALVLLGLLVPQSARADINKDPSITGPILGLYCMPDHASRLISMPNTPHPYWVASSNATTCIANMNLTTVHSDPYTYEIRACRQTTAQRDCEPDATLITKAFKPNTTTVVLFPDLNQIMSTEDSSDIVRFTLRVLDKKRTVVAARFFRITFITPTC